MAESFGMIFGHTLCDSSLMSEPVHVRFVFMMMVAIADEEHVVDIPVPQLARKMNLSIEDLSEALDRLSQPDDNSRTPTDDGRRIAKLDGFGWLIVNRESYSKLATMKATRKAKSAQNKANYKRRKAAASGTPWTDLPSDSEAAEENLGVMPEDFWTWKEGKGEAPEEDSHRTLSLQNESSSFSLIQAESVVLSTSTSTSESPSQFSSESHSESQSPSSSPSSSPSPSREAPANDARLGVMAAYNRVLTAFQTLFNTTVTEEDLKVVGSPVWFILEQEGEFSFTHQMEKHRGRGARGTYSVVDFVRDVYPKYYTSYATPRKNRLVPLPSPPVLQSQGDRPF